MWHIRDADTNVAMMQWKDFVGLFKKSAKYGDTNNRCIVKW